MLLESNLEKATIIAIIIAFIFLIGSNFVWNETGTISVDHSVCGADYVEVVLRDYNRQTGDNEGVQVFAHDTSTLYGCAIWNDLGYGKTEPTLVSANWGSYDISSLITNLEYRNVLGTSQTLIHVGDVSSYLNNNYGILNGDAYKATFEVVIKFQAEPQCAETFQFDENLYYDVKKNSDDSYSIWQYVEETDCWYVFSTDDIPNDNLVIDYDTLQELIMAFEGIECYSELDCPCYGVEGFTCECIDYKCISEEIPEVDYNTWLAYGIVIIVIILIILLIIKFR